MKSNKKISVSIFSSSALAGTILLVGNLLLISPMEIAAQQPIGNITSNLSSNGGGGGAQQQQTTQDSTSSLEEQNNKKLITEFTEASNDRNFSAIDQYVAENIIEHRPGVQSGRNSTIGFLQSLANAFPDFHTTIDQMIAEGDKVVVFTTTNGTHQGEFIFAPGIPPSGKQISFKTADMYRISNGQLVEHWDVIEILDMLTAIGAITFNQPATLPPTSLPTVNSTNTSNGT